MPANVNIVNPFAEGQAVTITTDLHIADDAILRPDNADPYEISDVVGGETSSSLEFFDMATHENGTGTILEAKLAKSHFDVTDASFRLYILLNGVDDIPDGTPFELFREDAWKFTGYIDFVCFKEAELGSLGLAFAHPNLPYRVAPGTLSLWGILVARAAYVPGNLEEFGITLTTQRN